MAQHEPVSRIEALCETDDREVPTADHRSSGSVMREIGPDPRADQTIGSRVLGSPPPYVRFWIAGAFQVPSSASHCGQYKRRIKKNGPPGAGSQLDSFSGPGDSFWMYSVRPPPASRFRVDIIGELIR